MPVYDSVLAARLIAGGDAAAQQLELAASNDADLSASDRSRELDKLRAIAGAQAELVIEGEEGERYLLVIANGAEETFAITDSRSPTQDLPARGAPFAPVRTKVSADEVLELLDHEDAEHLDDDEIRLPHLWSDRDEMVAKLAKVGPLLEGSTMLLAECDGRRYDVEIAYGAVTVTPLHPRCAQLARVLAILPDLAVRDVARTVPFDASTKRVPIPKVDPARPFTTGSARQRLDAFNAHTDYGDKHVALAPIIAAVRDEANRDDRFGELRRQIYHYLAKRDVPEVCALWLWALREESDAVAETVTYIGWRLDSVIAKLPDELRAAEARGDRRTVGRIKRLQAEAG